MRARRARACPVLRRLSPCPPPPPTAPTRLFKDNLAVLATNSTFLAGLTYLGLCMLPDQVFSRGVEDFNIRFGHKFAFYSCASIATCLNLAACVVASYAMIHGPALAIRGPHGSMSRAVGGMLDSRRL